MRKKYSIINIGCSRRGLDCQRIKEFLDKNNFSESGNYRKADLVILSTCGINKHFEDKAKKYLNKINKDIIIYGCLPATNPDMLKNLAHVRKIIISKDIQKFQSVFKNSPVKFQDIPDPNKIYARYSVPKLLKEAASSALLKIPSVKRHLGTIDIGKNTLKLRISWGCSGNCSFCSIKRAIGPLKSKKINEILAEIKYADQNKYTIDLLSSDSGSYGLDMHSTIINLITTILKKEPRIAINYIQDLNPHWLIKFNKQFLELVRQKKIKSLLVPIQSGSKRVLSLMNRDTNIEDLPHIINHFRTADFRIKTQIIVGFPTESVQEFSETVALINKAKFDEVDVFRYHETEMTPSRNIFPKIPGSEAERRIKYLTNNIRIKANIL